VLSVKARVVAVRDLPEGARPSYGRRRALARDARVATVPVGYADGYPRAMLDGGAEVLVRGRRRPLAGVVTMDQLLVECDDDVEVGDEVVLLGRQGDEEVSADEWARALGTISWEVLCGIKPRIPKLAVE
jgi:alanine racemase